MPRPTPKKRPPTTRAKTEKRPTTRRLLLEAAGEVFAEKGFDRATGAEICEPSSINPALISYHFGGMEGLYTAVLAEARERLAPFGSLMADLPEHLDERGKLRAMLNSWAETILGATSSSWMLRVSVREFVSPTPMSVELRDRQPLPWESFLRKNVAALMGLAPEHPAVSRGCLAVTAPLLLVMIADRRAMRAAYPRAGFSARDAANLVNDLVAYAVAGLAAMGEEARRGPPKAAAARSTTRPGSRVGKRRPRAEVDTEPNKSGIIE